MSKWLGVPKDWKKHLGFIYIIKHNKTGAFYIGKKLFWFKKTMAPLKGKERKRRSLVESDWKTYWGSSNDLQELIKKEGEESFTRVMVACFDTKWDLSYQELLLQLSHDAMHNPLCLNGIINVRLRRRK